MTANPDVLPVSFLLDGLPFRPDMSEGCTIGFDRVKQIKLCTHQLESIRKNFPDDWANLEAENQHRSSGRAELKTMVKLLIRHASESSDFYATVDFITKDVLKLLRERQDKRGKSFLKHLQDWSVISHEHMVPGEFIFRRFVRETDETLLQKMTDWSLRALVTGSKRNNAAGASSELKRLGGRLESDLPGRTEIEQMLGVPLEDIPLPFYGLVRYEAAGLAGGLIPVSERAKSILAAYRQFRAQHCRREYPPAAEHNGALPQSTLSAHI